MADTQLNDDREAILRDFFQKMTPKQGDRFMGWQTNTCANAIRAGRLGYIQLFDSTRKYVTPALLAEYVKACTHHVTTEQEVVA